MCFTMLLLPMHLFQNDDVITMEILRVFSTLQFHLFAISCQQVLDRRVLDAVSEAHVEQIQQTFVSTLEVLRLFKIKSLFCGMFDWNDFQVNRA